MLRRYQVLTIISVLVLFSLACSFSSFLGKVFGTGGIENSVYILQEEMDSVNGVGRCEPNWWNTDYWNTNILPLLAESDAHCWDFTPYFNCVQDRAQAGDCPDQASSYCAPVYKLLLNESTKGEVKIRDDKLHVRDDDNIFATQFSMSGGSVEGFVHIDFRTEYGDGDYCEVIQDKVFSGSYDPGSCTLTGTVTITETHDENRNDICWGDPYEKTENWSMVIKDGKLGPGGPYNQIVGETYYLPNLVKVYE